MVDILAQTEGDPDERRQPAKPPSPAPSPSDAAYDRALGALTGAQEQELGIRRQEAAELGPARQRVLAGMRDYTRTADTELQKLRAGTKDVPAYQPTDIRQSSWDWMAMSATFGAIAGAFSRYHTTTALNAFSGAMQGWYQGNIVKFNQEYQTWKANADAARINNDKAQREYEMVLANKRLNLDQQMAEVEMIGAKYQDQLAMSLAQQKNITQLAQLMDHREATQAKMGEAQAKIEATIAKMQVEMAKLDPSRLNVNTAGGAAAMLDQITKLYQSGPQGQQLAKLMWSKLWSGSSTPPPDLDTALGGNNADVNKPGLISKLAGLFGVKQETPGAAAGSTETAPGAAAGATPAATPAAPAAPAAPTMIPPPAGSAPGTPAVQSPVSRLQQALPTPGPARGPVTGEQMRQRNARAGRDGSSEDKALVLSSDRKQAAGEAGQLPDGTWVILPPDRTPVQIKRKTAPAAPAAPAPEATQANARNALNIQF